MNVLLRDKVRGKNFLYAAGTVLISNNDILIIIKTRRWLRGLYSSRSENIFQRPCLKICPICLLQKSCSNLQNTGTYSFTAISAPARLLRWRHCSGSSHTRATSVSVSTMTDLLSSIVPARLRKKANCSMRILMPINSL